MHETDVGDSNRLSIFISLSQHVVRIFVYTKLLRLSCAVSVPIIHNFGALSCNVK